MGLSEKIHLFCFDTEKVNYTLQALAFSILSHPALSFLVALPDAWPIPKGNSEVEALKISLKTDCLLKTARVKWERKCLHTEWEFLPMCKVGMTEERNLTLTFYSIFSVWRCFEWLWEKMCVLERKAASKISASRLLRLGSTGTVLTQGKQLFKTKHTEGSGSAWCYLHHNAQRMCDANSSL